MAGGYSQADVFVLEHLIGWREMVTGLGESSAAMHELGTQTEETGAKAVLTGKQFNIANQAQFTMRRLAYGATLAVVGAGVAALHMGWAYTSAMQQASVALQPVFHGTQALNQEMTHLFRFSAFTPFQFKDITIAFRQMYGAFHPLGISVGETNQTLESMVNALSFVGRTSPGALNRVAVALQHMAFQGRLTGQTVLQLARDGLPIYSALTTELGLTASQMHQIGSLGIPALTALQAINKYVATTPGYMNAAMRQATRTLQGAFTTFKDLLSQAVGSAQGGFFGGLQHAFASIDKQLAPFYKTGKPLTLTAFVTAINNVLSPKTGLVLNTFKTIQGLLVGLTQTLKGFADMVKFVTGTLLGFIGAGQHGGVVFFWFGRILGTILGIWVLWRGYLILNRIYLLSLIAAQKLYNLVSLATWIVTDAENASLAFQVFLLERGLVPALIRAVIRLWGYITAQFVAIANQWDWSVSLVITATALWESLIPAIVAATGAIWGMVSAIVAFLFTNPVGWVILLVMALTGLYFKWKAFHDLVNKTAMYLAHNWKMALVIAFAPILVPLVLMIKHLQTILNLASKIASPFKRIGHWFGNLWHGVASGIPHFALGGMMTHSGLALVGERGPEVVALPSGASVSPTNRADSLRFGGMPQYVQLTSNVLLDSKVLAQAVTKYKLDAQARE